LSAALVVPVDKIKNYLEASGNRFGEHVEPSQVYKSLSVPAGNISEVYNVYYGTDDFELSRTSYIFQVEYGSIKKSERIGDLPLDMTMIEYNNRFAEKLKRFKEKGFAARSERYFIGDSEFGYDLGDIRAINLDEKRFIGRMSDVTYTYKYVYQGIERPKNPVIADMLNDWLSDDNFDREGLVTRIHHLSGKEKSNDKNRELIGAIMNFDPLRSKRRKQPFADDGPKLPF
jgi:hypothetical protein